MEVDVEHVTEEQYEAVRADLTNRLATEQAYLAIARSYIFALTLCPEANPSDLWQHILYRLFIEGGRNEQSWKRASGQAFETAIAEIYNPRLIEYGVRLVVLSNSTATRALQEMNLTGQIAPSKMDIAIEGYDNTSGAWKIFGVVHGKTSIAERIKDDAPASHVIMKAGFFSVLATLDSKSFPPPHGNGINWGELGGRTVGQSRTTAQPKRDYFEVDGDFHFGYSYNLRTPESPEVTPSGSRIKTLSFSMKQPDEFVKDMVNYWKNEKARLIKSQAATVVLNEPTS
ncbi:MAG: Restriction endonuclease [Parcubacteria group bacterium GW2011_GWD2_42_14]|nr:MAG: Restriction endonuclease [Parcubacteria group bacterium GW2011_GWD2_42_14]